MSPTVAPSAAVAPIVCQSLIRKDEVRSADGGLLGYRDTILSRRLTINLKKGQVLKHVDQQNRVTEESVEGWNVSFSMEGVLEISPSEIAAHGMTREEVVKILRAASPGRFDVLEPSPGK